MDSCRQIICVVAASSGFQWQSYVPTLALLVTEDIGGSISMVGYLYLAFVGMSIVGSVLLYTHLRFLSPYQLLGIGFAVRGLSGVLHALGCALQGAGVTAAVFPLLILSRLTHGYTILLFPLSVIWIGARESIENKQVTLARRNVYSTMGIFNGVLAGSLLAAILPTSLQAGAAPGYLNIVVSAVMLGWLYTSFYDRDLLPSGKGGSASAPKRDEDVPWLHLMLVSWAQFTGWMGFVAIEGSLSVIIVEAYGFTHQSVIYAWVPISAMMLAGTIAFSYLHKTLKYRPRAISRIALAALGIASISLCYTLYRTDVYGSSVTKSSSASLVLGVGALLFAFALTNTLFNGLLMVQLLPHQQAKYQTPVQTLSAVGRGVGPYVGTLLMAYGDEYSMGLGPQLLVGFSYFTITSSILVPSFFGDRFYSEPSPSQAAAQPPKKAML